MTSHTPGQIECGERGYGSVNLWAVDGPLVATVSNDEVASEVAEANADRLMLAWNCHDDLLAACKAALPWVATAMAHRRDSRPEFDAHQQAVANHEADLATLVAAINKAEQTA